MNFSQVKRIARKPTLKDQHIREYSILTNSRATPQPIEDEFNPDKMVKKKLKEAMERAKAIADYKKIRMYLPEDERKDFDKEIGIVKEDDEGNTQTSSNEDMLPMLELLKQEKDPKVRQQLAMAMMSKKGGIDSNMMLLAMMMPQQKQEDNTSFEKEMMRKIIDRELSGNNKETLKDKLEEIKAIQEMMGGQGSEIDDFIEKKKKMEELGMIKNQGNTIEEKKLDLDYKKFEFEKNREMEKEESDAEFKKKAMAEGIKAFPKIIQAFGKNNKKIQEKYEDEQEEEPEPEPPKETPQPIPSQQKDVIEYTCKNPECKRPILITHLDRRPRRLLCPNIANRECDRMYELREDGQIAEYQLSERDLEDAIKEFGGKEKEDETKDKG